MYYTFLKYAYNFVRQTKVIFTYNLWTTMEELGLSIVRNCAFTHVVHSGRLSES